MFGLYFLLRQRDNLIENSQIQIPHTNQVMSRGLYFFFGVDFSRAYSRKEK